MKNESLYLWSIFCSNFGEGIRQVTMIWLVYRLTGSAASIGLLLALYYLPSMLITPFASVYVDYHEAKKLVLIIEVCFAAILFIMALSMYFQWQSFLLYCALQLCLAFCYSVYKPASQSFIKETFSNQDIPNVLGKSTSLSELALILGIGAAGLLFINLSLTLCFIINALLFCLSSVLIFFMKTMDGLPKQEKVSFHYFEEIKSGLQYVRETNGLSYLLLLSVINSISIQMATTLFLPLAETFDGGSKLYAAFEITFAVGGITAGLVVVQLLKNYKHKVVYMTMFGMTSSSLCLSISSSPFLFFFCIFILGLSTMAHLASIQTLIQLYTEKKVIGRVMGVRTILASLVKVASALSTGVLIGVLGTGGVLISFSILVLVVLSFTLKNISLLKVEI
ncbi:MFS transporter [Viridibacillus sp. YIM B01967]|uniref:MFS transporter n=1 Tax=Viridibacillus soli TaxID=2798301 RepID=A0ABS1H401_9BACL|nr:MFS transporter [Viridibacillus soli]MBK3494155.1 MFS transporter [Viridibacillus soli]